MPAHRIHNFNPGPAALPETVLAEIRDDFLNYDRTGMSVMEMSHRSKAFEEIVNEGVNRVKRLLNLSDDHAVLFLQGGASLQFCMVPMNLAGDETTEYVNTGTWSTKAIKEAKALGKRVRVTASTEAAGYARIPDTVPVGEDAAYVHITSNNTIKGTQWVQFPETGTVPLTADMSSDIFSRRLDATPFGLIYAGAQKNIGPAGLTLVIIRKDMLARVPASLPTALKYTTYAEKNSLFNTPPAFAIYVTGRVLAWLEETVGGLAKMEAINKRKAEMLYDVIDEGDFYRGTAEPGSRSKMNITFRLPDETLEKQFVESAFSAGFAGLKGHRSVGGCRASIYNAVPEASVAALAEFMREFARNR
jgi:phosphoserine aminotransferase